jgi:hypothetical protein
VGGEAAAGSGGTSAGARCGTRGGVECADDEFCNTEPDRDCGGTDRGGRCQAKTQICTAIYAPVCGCDNRSYSSACVAHSAGVSVQRDGLCGPSECDAAGGHASSDCATGEDSWSISGGNGQETLCCVPPARGKTCGGIAALSCDDGDFCNYEEAAGGQGCDGSVADSGGVCEAKPSDCPDETQPVCSCDHHSFNGICAAHASGSAVLHDGGCTQQDCDAVGGRVAYGIGPAAICRANEMEYTWLTSDNGGPLPIEGATCCVPNP